MARMAEAHADNQMIQRALAGKVKEDEDRALMKISRKKHHKSSHLLIQLPEYGPSRSFPGARANNPGGQGNGQM